MKIIKLNKKFKKRKKKVGGWCEGSIRGTNHVILTTTTTIKKSLLRSYIIIIHIVRWDVGNTRGVICLYTTHMYIKIYAAACSSIVYSLKVNEWIVVTL